MAKLLKSEYGIFRRIYDTFSTKIENHVYTINRRNGFGPVSDLVEVNDHCQLTKVVTTTSFNIRTALLLTAPGAA